MTTDKIVAAIVAILLIVGAFYIISAYVNKEPEVAENTYPNHTPGSKGNTQNVVGCYVATLGKDVYSLKISSQEEKNVSGTLVFKNFQKDSSSGTFKGTYENGILLGDYSFRSEGMDSTMQVIFKKSGSDFVRGYGPLNPDGARFSDLTKITYDPAQTFKATATCATSLLS